MSRKQGDRIIIKYFMWISVITLSALSSNIQENLPVAFAMLEKVPDKWRCHSYTGIGSDSTENLGG